MARPESPPLLRLEDLHASYGPIAALRGLDLVVAPGELVCLIGANGAGKTSTLRVISGLLPPARGRIVFDGREIQGDAPAAILKAGIAHCPEGRRVFPYLTVEENLAMGAYVRRDRSAIAVDVDEVCGHFPILAERRRQMAGTLSGGEQQMLAIARALSVGADVREHRGQSAGLDVRAHGREERLGLAVDGRSRLADGDRAHSP